MGWFGSWAITIAALVLIVAVTRYVQKRRVPPPVDAVPSGVGLGRALRGSWPLQVLGFHPEVWAFWQQPQQAKMLAGPILTDKTSLTDIGIMFGAALAAAAGGAWALHKRIPWRTALAAILGGIIMGIGARLAQGCNIGAYLAGIASGSLHGWIWGLAALGGTWMGLRGRALFGLPNPKPRDSVC